MKKRLAKLMPSMYQRRLLLIAMAAVGALTLPLLQIAGLTVVKGEELREQAESKLVNRTWIGTVRGSILDRKGRVLAADRASFDVAIEYQVLTGKWAYTQAAVSAQSLNPTWNELSPEERDELIAARLPEFHDRLERMYETVAQIARVPRSELDDRRHAILDQVKALAVTITEANRRAMEKELNQGEAVLAMEDDDRARREPVSVRTAEVARKIVEEESSHTILPDVPDDVGFRLRQLTINARAGQSGSGVISTLPGLSVRDSVVREYPLETMDVPIQTETLPGPLRTKGTRTIRVTGVGTHLLGWVRERAYDQDIARRNLELLKRAGKETPAMPSPTQKPAAWTAAARDVAKQARTLGEDRGRYFPGDAVGAFGVEYANEFELRGIRGSLQRHLETDHVTTLEPQGGKPITLTIDVMLQARMQALYDPSLGLAVAQPWHQARHDEEETGKPQDLPLGTPLNGAAVVLDVRSGDILAMVSMPSFSRHDLKERPREYWEDKYRTPMINRSTFKWYTPGSIVKPLVLCAASSAGKIGHQERIDCTGHFFPDKPLLYRCWIYKNPQLQTTHTARLGHALEAEEAIACSCNIFFFEMGKRLGPRGVLDWYTKFGVGRNAEAWNLGIGQESSGSLPRDAAAMDLSEAILMGIGQGPIAWTPLHAADAYATIARGGVRIVPRIRVDAPVRQRDLGFDPVAVQQALDGLRASANSSIGTTYTVKIPQPDGEWRHERIFTAPGINVWAKSGTADVAPFKADLGEYGGQAVYDGDHAWTVCLAGVGRPEYAIAVVVDHGGSGGKCAGPIANQIVYALIAEGYLPDLSTKNAPTEEDSEN